MFTTVRVLSDAVVQSVLMTMPVHGARDTDLVSMVVLFCASFGIISATGFLITNIMAIAGS